MVARKKVAKKAHALRAELYRGLVLGAAEKEFAAHGFTSARMQRVADGVGLSVGTLYNLFESKDALYEAILKQRGDALTERVVKALGVDGSLLDKLSRAAHEQLRFSAEYPDYLRILLQRATLWASPSAHAPGAEARNFKRTIDLAVSMVKQAIAQRELREGDPRTMVATLTAVHQARVQRWLETGMREPAAQVADEIMELFRRMYAL